MVDKKYFFGSKIVIFLMFLLFIALVVFADISLYQGFMMFIGILILVFLVDIGQLLKAFYDLEQLKSSKNDTQKIE